MITTTFSQHPCLQKHFDHSWQANNSLRQAMQYALAPLVRQAPVSVVVVGSYGRCEVSRISDIDFFIAHDGSMSEARLLDVLHQVKNLVRPLSWPGESDESKFGQGAFSLYARTDPLYREISIVGKAFSKGLEQWLVAQYPGHPILHALLF